MRQAAKKLKAPVGVEHEDIIAAGMLAAVQAADAYDPSLGVPWRAYVTQKVKWAMSDELGRENRRSSANVMERAGKGEIRVPTSTDPAKVAEAREVVFTVKVGRVAESLPPADAVAERVAKLREVMYGAIKEEDVLEMMQAVMSKAKTGSTAAAKLVMDFLTPARGGSKTVQQQAIIINGDDIR